MTAPPSVGPARTGVTNIAGPGALILGGAHGSLAVARSLGRRGIPVWFVTHDHPITRYSRYTTHSLTWPGPDEKGAAEWLVDLPPRHRLDLLVLSPGAHPAAPPDGRRHHGAPQVL